MGKDGSSSGGIGLPGVLFVAFVVLKLVGVIKWSWFWVASPLWISIILAVCVVALYFGIAFIISGVSDE